MTPPGPDAPGTGTGTALITGASAGIGQELARAFARHGHDVVLVARREERLQELARELRNDSGVAAHVLPGDLAQAGAADELAARLRQDGLTVRHLVNNAGLGDYGPFAAADPVRIHTILQLNVTALTQLTRIILPDLVAARAGGVLNVSSTAGFEPGPLMAVYYASKAYVTSFTEALHEELRGTGVRVTALCPGPTESEFRSRAGMEKSGLFRRLAVMSAADVARTGYRDHMAGKALSIPGVLNKGTPLAVRLVPRAAVRRLVHWINGE